MTKTDDFCHVWRFKGKGAIPSLGQIKKVSVIGVTGLNILGRVVRHIFFFLEKI